MKVAIVGSRTLHPSTPEIKQALDIAGFEPTEIVSGGANGVDFRAERYAEDNELKMTIFRAEWSKNGKSAGYMRNKLIVDYSDAVLVFWDGASMGTQHTMDLSYKADKPTYVVVPKEGGVGWSPHPMKHPMQ